MQELTKLSEQINKANKDKGFWNEPQPNFGEKLMLVVTEISEALEAHRSGKFADPMQLVKVLNNPNFDADRFKTWIKDTTEDEIADAIIRLLDLAGHYKIDIGGHIEAKLRYNKTREQKHGKRY